jgi:RNA polymerase sigma-70 factor (ECF subfamily)
MEDLRDDIVISFSKGDESAFKAIYDALNRQLIHFCRCFVSMEDAKDIAAETFFKLWNMRSRWNTINNVKAFLYITARNACLNFLRSERTKIVNEKKIAELLEREEKMILLSEIQSDLINLIMLEIESLPDNCKKVFKMSVLEGYETAEIAAKLNIAPQTVFNLKYIAAKTIKSAIFKRGVQINMIATLMLQVAKRL